METTKLSSKGQVILPKAIRQSRSWLPGVIFAVEDRAEGVLLRPLNPFPPTRLDDVVGSAGYKGKAKSLAAMDKAVAKAAKARRDRG
ncbi:MAG: AbrB/MazE/SpoVT family DNA-binding domain-containing protein [Rhodospirillales bacterium]|nr:AbrB/MazE/SpoVT family DNA-binding domain-containing protein [Rhodospirillales bacterium]